MGMAWCGTMLGRDQTRASAQGSSWHEVAHCQCHNTRYGAMTSQSLLSQFVAEQQGCRGIKEVISSHQCSLERSRLLGCCHARLVGQLCLPQVLPHAV